ncbi:hypothetical protein V6Z11_D10G033200 [Gossypium hirsutum]
MKLTMSNYSMEKARIFYAAQIGAPIRREEFKFFTFTTGVDWTGPYSTYFLDFSSVFSYTQLGEWIWAFEVLMPANKLGFLPLKYIHKNQSIFFLKSNQSKDENL